TSARSSRPVREQKASSRAAPLRRGCRNQVPSWQSSREPEFRIRKGARYSYNVLVSAGGDRLSILHVPVRFDDVIRILQSVPGQNGRDSRIAIHLSTLGQFSNSRQSGRRGRLAANAIAPDRRFRLSNLIVGDIHDQPACEFDGSQRLFPGAWIPDSNGGSDGIGLLHRPKLL